MGQTNMSAFALQAAVCVPRKTKRGPLVKKNKTFPLKCVKMCLCHQSPPKAGGVLAVSN